MARDRYVRHDIEDFEQQVMAHRAGHSVGQNAPMDIDSAWNHLTAGKTIGKRVVIEGPNLAAPKTGPGLNLSPVNILEIGGTDRDAMTLGITLLPPQFFDFAPVALPANLQELNTSQDNAQMAAGTFCRSAALVSWGIGGVAANEVECDFSNGLTINVQASFLRIGAKIDPTSAGSDRIAYILSAFVGPGHSSPSCARTQTALGNLAATVQSAVFATPKFAKSCTPMAAVGASPNWTLRFFRNRAATQETARFIWSNATPGNCLMGQMVPVPSDGYYFTLTNDSGIQQENCDVIFDLAI